MTLAQITPADTLGLDDLLGSLIEESRQDKQDKAKLKEVRKVVKKTNLPGAVRQAADREIKQLEVRVEWKEIADVMWIKRNICKKCQNETPSLWGYFRKSKSRIGGAYKYTPITLDAPSGLPREMKTDMEDVDLCADCLPEELMSGGWMEPEMECAQKEEEQDDDDDLAEFFEDDEDDGSNVPDINTHPFAGESNQLDLEDSQQELEDELTEFSHIPD